MSSADLHLDDADVSHRHAYLQMVVGRMWCVDLGSRTGTHWDTSEQVAGPLSGRRGIHIGPYTIRQGDESSSDENASILPANPLSNESDDASILPRVVLEFRGGATRLRKWLVDRALTLVGRASFCKVRLHSTMVSRAHCALLNTPNGLWLIDLLGREGTYVNDTAVRWTRLEHEDELHIDQFRIRVRYLPSAPRTMTPVRLIGRDEEQNKSTNALQPVPQLNEPYSTVANSSLQAFVPPAPVPGMNGNESLLLPLISQFSLMQQQMFDQFQQTLLVMAQMFGNLHREQMTLVREELDHIQDLTRQLQALQLESTRPRTAPLPRGTP